MVWPWGGDWAGPAAVSERFFELWSAGDPDSAGIELLPVRLAQATAVVLGADGAGLSALNGAFRVPLGASGDDAAAAERLQFTQGEGPCLAALRSGRAEMSSEEQIASRWPSLYGELIARTPYRSVVSVPLSIAGEEGGAVDLYLVGPGQAERVDLADASAVAAQISAALSLGARATTRTDDRPGPGWLYGPAPASRMLVWVAIGMLNLDLRISSADALAMLRSYAYARGQAVDDVAAALVIDQTLDVSQLRI